MFTIDSVAISNQISRSPVFRKCLNDLLCGPEGSRMGRHIEVDHLPSVVQQDHEAVQNVESHSGHREEVNRYNLAGMIGQKTLPVL